MNKQVLRILEMEFLCKNKFQNTNLFIHRSLPPPHGSDVNIDSMTGLVAFRVHYRPGTGRYQPPRLLANGGDILKILGYLGEIA